MLWESAEQDGTFDEIKSNVFGIIQGLITSGLPHSHMDILFSKFSANDERCLRDRLRLLEMLQNLAEHDVAVSLDPLLAEQEWPFRLLTRPKLPDSHP